MRRNGLLLAALVCAACPAAEFPDLDGARRFQLEAGEAYRAGDYHRFTEATEQALASNPASLATRYNLAAGYARTGRHDDAMRELRALATARADFGVAEDDDFASLRGSAAFETLLRELATDLEPVAGSSVRFTVDQLGLIPEGIAIDTTTDRTFFGSMRTGDIYVMDHERQLSKFAGVAHEGKLAAIGLFVDAERDVLWAVGSSFFAAEGNDPESPSYSGIFGFELDSGKLKHKLLADDGSVAFNDVTVGPNGDLYISGGVLSTVAAGSERIVPLDTEPPVAGTNGVAASPDGRHLFVSSYPVGIAVIDLESRRARFLDTPEDAPLYGVDGLYWHDGDLIAVQNGIKPWRLARITLNGDLTAVSGVRLVEMANPDLEPTTGAIVGDTIHYIGTGPAPANPPSHFPENIRGWLGKTIVMTAPLE